MSQPAANTPAANDTVKSLVSVIIPSHNYAGYVAEAINSALNQTYKHVEILVCDDGSKDATPQILEAYGDRIRFVRHNTPRGASAARNAVLKLAKGEYVALLDADDLWLPDKLEKQVAAMEAEPNAGLCHTGYEAFNHPTESGPKIEPEGYRMHGDCFHLIWEYNTILTSSVLMRRSMMPAHGFYEDVRVVEDWEMWLYILYKHTAIYLTDITTRYRRHPVQTIAWGGAKSLVYRALPRLRFLEQCGDAFAPEKRQEMRKFALDQLKEHTYSRYWNGDYATALMGFDLLKRFGGEKPSARHYLNAKLRSMCNGH